MPMNRSLYPAGWEAFSISIRAGRALHRCECTGECGLHKNDLAGFRCREVNKQAARFFHGRVVLTVAHLCDCYPLCADPGHVKAMCQRCHLRVDRFRHSASRVRTQAGPSYKAQRYRNLGKAVGFEHLQELERLPQKKRRRPWFTPLVTK